MNPSLQSAPHFTIYKIHLIQTQKRQVFQLHKLYDNYLVTHTTPPQINRAQNSLIQFDSTSFHNTILKALDQIPQEKKEKSPPE